MNSFPVLIYDLSAIKKNVQSKCVVKIQPYQLNITIFIAYNIRMITTYYDETFCRRTYDRSPEFYHRYSYTGVG